MCSDLRNGLGKSNRKLGSEGSLVEVLSCRVIGASGSESQYSSRHGPNLLSPAPEKQLSRLTTSERRCQSEHSLLPQRYNIFLIICSCSKAPFSRSLSSV